MCTLYYTGIAALIVHHGFPYIYQSVSVHRYFADARATDHPLSSEGHCFDWIGK